MAMPWFRVLVIGFSSRSLGLNSSSVNVSFVVETVALERTAFWVLRSVFVRIFRINVPYSYPSACCCYQEDTVEKPRRPPKTTFLWKSGSIGWKSNFPPFFFCLQATDRGLFQVVSSCFLVLLSPGIIVSSHSYSFMLAVHFFRSHARNIMKLLT